MGWPGAVRQELGRAPCPGLSQGGALPELCPSASSGAQVSAGRHADVTINGDAGLAVQLQADGAEPRGTCLLPGTAPP